MLLTCLIMYFWLSFWLRWWFRLCRYVVIGRSFFSVNLGIENLGKGLECWKGYYESIWSKCVFPLRILSLWFPPLMHFLLPQRNIDCIGFLWYHHALLKLLCFLLIFLLCLEGGREIDDLVYYGVLVARRTMSRTCIASCRDYDLRPKIYSWRLCILTLAENLMVFWIFWMSMAIEWIAKLNVSNICYLLRIMFCIRLCIVN